MRPGSLLATVWLVLGAGTAAAGPPPADPSVEALTRALTAADVRYRRWAAWELGRAGAAAAPAVSALVLALDADDTLTRRYATDALVAIGPAAVDALTAILTQGPRLRSQAEKALSRMGAAGVPSILAALERSSDPRVRRSAATALGSIGPDAAAAIPVLARELGREEQRSVGVALGRMGEAALPALVAILDSNPGSDSREHVVRALGEMGPTARPVVEHVIGVAIDDPDRRVRSRAVRALGAIGGDDAVAVLGRRLREDPSTIVRAEAAQALGQASSGDAASIAILVETLELGESGVASRAAMGLGAIGKPALPAALGALRHESPVVRAHAVEAVRYLAVEPELVIPSLVEAFADPEESVRRSASVTLQLLGDVSLEPLLAALDERPEPEVRGWAALTLGNLEPPPASAVPGLAGALEDDEPTVREIACWSLGKIGELAGSAVSALVEVLAADDPVLRRNAAWALGNVGADAASAEDALVARLDDADPEVAAEAREALEKIRGHYDSAREVAQ